MSRVFVSYRREPTRIFSCWLYDQLKRTLREDRVQMDTKSIKPGDVFPEWIEETVPQADVVLLLIDESWNGEKSLSLSRLRDPEDFVRREIELALESGAFIAPVLVDSAEMPPSRELPESLSDLTTLQAHRIHTAKFSEEVKPLMGLIRRKLLSVGIRRHLRLWIVALALGILGGGVASTFLKDALTEAFSKQYPAEPIEARIPELNVGVHEGPRFGDLVPLSPATRPVFVDPDSLLFVSIESTPDPESVSPRTLALRDAAEKLPKLRDKVAELARQLSYAGPTIDSASIEEGLARVEGDARTAIDGLASTEPPVLARMEVEQVSTATSSLSLLLTAVMREHRILADRMQDSARQILFFSVRARSSPIVGSDRTIPVEGYEFSEPYIADAQLREELVEAQETYRALDRALSRASLSDSPLGAELSTTLDLAGENVHGPLERLAAQVSLFTELQVPAHQPRLQLTPPPTVVDLLREGVTDGDRLILTLAVRKDLDQERDMVRWDYSVEVLPWAKIRRQRALELILGAVVGGLLSLIAIRMALPKDRSGLDSWARFWAGLFAALGGAVGGVAMVLLPWFFDPEYRTRVTGYGSVIFLVSLFVVSRFVVFRKSDPGSSPAVDPAP